MGRLIATMIDFAEVEHAVEQLNRQFSHGALDKDTFRTHLVDTIDFADDGYYWMVGYKSGLWYRHDGTQWLVDNPDRLLTLVSQQNVITRFNDTDKVPASFFASNHHSTTNQESSIDWLWLLLGIILLSFTAGVVYTSV
ncbi:MAG: hypothetical protein KDJ52_02750 [Anaerolineae bacterium]|nr:hypothetical protein [Anaerolineae bacterium]